MMRLNTEHLTDAAYRHFRNPSPEIQTALLEARNPRLIQFRTEWFPTIFGEESLQARESYDDDPTTFLKSISYAAEQSLKDISDTTPPEIQVTIIDHHETRTSIADIGRKLINKKITIEGIVSTKTIRTPEVTGAHYTCPCGQKRRRNKESGRELRKTIPCNNLKGCTDDMRLTDYEITDTIDIYIDEDYADANPEDLKKTLIRLTNNLTSKDTDRKLLWGTMSDSFTSKSEVTRRYLK
jgi:DNA replicative helicase MCM subunit Mcm2 (Cdc46/Mcm family)